MTKYRDTGTIYKSFIEPLETIKTYKEKYFYLKSVMELALFGEIISKNKEENLINYDDFAEEILQNLDKNRMFFSKIALVNLIPNTRNCYKKYLNGNAGKEFGYLGGAPIGNKNASKNNPKTTPDIEEEKEIEKEKREEIKNIELESSQDEEYNNFHEYKLYGYNHNVCLTQSNINSLEDYLYKQLSNHIFITQELSDKALGQILIRELDDNIERGKEKRFDNDNPLDHYTILQKYIKQKLTEEQRKDFIDTIQQLKQGECV